MLARILQLQFGWAAVVSERDTCRCYKVQAVAENDFPNIHNRSRTIAHEPKANHTAGLSLFASSPLTMSDYMPHSLTKVPDRWISTAIVCILMLARR